MNCLGLDRNSTPIGSRPARDESSAGFDRVGEVLGGVSWLISWPRKKLITNPTAEPQFSMAA
jgi:hypothetical protein